MTRRSLRSVVPAILALSVVVGAGCVPQEASGPTSPIVGVLTPWGPDRPSESYDLVQTAWVCTPTGTPVTVALAGNDDEGVVFVSGTASLAPGTEVVTSGPTSVPTGGGTVVVTSTTACWSIILGYAAYFADHTADIAYSVSW